MSMISSLIDELRELALWLDDEFYDAEATKVRDAADTIWQFRDDLQRANAENAKLRDERDRMYKANVKKNGEILRLLEENAKLRELVNHMVTHIEFTSEEDGEPMCWRCPYGKSESSCDFEQRVAALGIEVNT